ncbi:MAG: Peptidyl-tRNA hydrolase [Elusimicrobia bacterium ADurb.Bin231]|nr:MAG: Peptidyl-tRNA hydrolase [Elusimicrobia bacterium ADurb.Bin231]
MKFIVGLGNPGKKYSKTRHNIGFMVLDRFAETANLSWKHSGDRAYISSGDNFMLIKPQLYMNNTGTALSLTIKKYISHENILLVYDDMDIDLGRIKIKKTGSAAGHKGVQSVIDVLDTREFCRLRVGIGRPPENIDPVDYVLSEFKKSEMELLKTSIETSSQAISAYLDYGISVAMNKFNKKPEKSLQDSGGE